MIPTGFLVGIFYFYKMGSFKKPIVIVEYDPQWQVQFSLLRELYIGLLDDKLMAVEHVGSTAVEGLCAKPVIDIDLVIEGVAELEGIIPILCGLGYEYLGVVSIPDRFVFRPVGSSVPRDGSAKVWPKHHLYACIEGSTALVNHILLRDSLREDSSLLSAYATLKKRLALESPDMDGYVMGKTDFICGILRAKGMTFSELSAIAEQNKTVIPLGR